MCFVETYMHGSNFTEISNHINGWKDIHIRTEHRLSFCFKEQSLKVLEEIPVTTAVDTLTLVLNNKGEFTLLILLYSPPGTIYSFVTDLILVRECPVHCKCYKNITSWRL